MICNSAWGSANYRFTLPSRSLSFHRDSVGISLPASLMKSNMTGILHASKRRQLDVTCTRIVKAFSPLAPHSLHPAWVHEHIPPKQQGFAGGSRSSAPSSPPPPVLCTLFNSPQSSAFSHSHRGWVPSTLGFRSVVSLTCAGSILFSPVQFPAAQLSEKVTLVTQDGR